MIQDRVGAHAVLVRLFSQYTPLQTAHVDGGYTGKLLGWAKEMFGYCVKVVKRTEAIASSCSPNAGSSNARTHGSTTRANFPKTMKSVQTPPKPSSTSPSLISPCGN